MRLSSDGLPFILPPALIATGLLATGWTSAAFVALLVTGCVAAFFRDPERQCDAPAGHVASPADGRVVRVERDERGRLRVAVFLSVFNVHVARSPLGGRLESCRRIPGPLRAAFREEASENARVLLRLRTGHGPIEVALMAGLVARRVLTWVAPPAVLQRGQRIAIIRFGSRAEVRLPRSYEPTVSVGDRVRAGQTVLARPSESDRSDHGP